MQGGVKLRKTVLRFAKLATPPGDDKLLLKGRLLFNPARPAIDPLANGMRLIIENAQGARLFDIDLPGGPLVGSGRGWRLNDAGTVFVFKSPTPVGGLVRRARVKLPPAKPKRIDIRIDGRGLDLVQAAAAAPARVVALIDPPGARAGRCAETAFPGPPAASCTRKEVALVCR